MEAIKMAFDIWLTNKLQSLNLDDDMFLEYLKGVLADEDSDEQDIKGELAGILEGAIEGAVEEHCMEIFNEWKRNQEHQISNSCSEQQENGKGDVEVNDKIRSIIEKQQSTTAPIKSSKTDANEDKSALLAKYAHVSDEEDEYESDEDKKTSSQPKDTNLFKNINTQAIIDKQRAEREKQKKEHDEKKVRDKQNREAEKLKRQERQDKEKKRTQKGEKRR